MLLIRAILPDWAKAETPELPKVVEGVFERAKIEELNAAGYNIYYLPNYPSKLPKSTIDGTHIDTFEYVYVDMDLKEKKYSDKDSFIAALAGLSIPPTSVVDSGNGIHVYWRVLDLDAMSFLKLQRRLMRRLVTDEAVAKIYQLMRQPGTWNTKVKGDFKLCEILYTSDLEYTCEQIDSKLPVITKEDENYCIQHFDKTYKRNIKNIQVDDKLPLKFGKLLSSNKEIKEMWGGSSSDRSGADYRLGHIMYANNFTKEEAMSVLVNSAKALERSPVHRVNYAQNIVDKIWIYEQATSKQELILSNSVRDILARGDEVISGVRFECHPYVDDTVTGFRLGHVMGLVAGSGVGKTAVAMNMFKWFAERNPDYDHFFVGLEQPDNELAARWRTICQGDERLHDKVHILSNHGQDGTFRHLSLDDIREYILAFQKKTNKKIGTVVIDHIGALKKQGKNGENEAIVDICHKMKSFAIETNTMVIMQSQAPREKAGIGDLELNKDAAYGTVFFESYVDWLMTIWQPLKRAYSQGAPTVLAFKYCKIRHKKQGKDKIQEDVCYRLFFDPETETLRELTQIEEKACDFYQNQCINIRKRDRKTDIVAYESRKTTKDVDGKSDISKNSI